ncbi:MAG: LuxR C-terminal-related transcriptional regulator [Planctomycetota bacterium]
MTQDVQAFDPAAEKRVPTQATTNRAILVGMESEVATYASKHLEQCKVEFDLAPLTRRFEILPDRYSVGIVCFDQERRDQAVQAVKFLNDNHIPTLVILAADSESLSSIAAQSGASDTLILPIRHRDFEDALDTVVYQREIERHHREMAQYARSLEQLTPRERRVIQLAADGLPNKQIASAVSLSVKSIERIRRDAYKKLNVRSIAEMTRVFLLGSMHSYLGGSPIVPKPHLDMRGFGTSTPVLTK